MGWANAVKIRTAKSNKSKKHQRPAGVPDMASIREMGELIGPFERTMHVEEW